MGEINVNVVSVYVSRLQRKMTNVVVRAQINFPLWPMLILKNKLSTIYILYLYVFAVFHFIVYIGTI